MLGGFGFLALELHLMWQHTPRHTRAGDESMSAATIQWTSHKANDGDVCVSQFAAALCLNSQTLYLLFPVVRRAVDDVRVVLIYLAVCRPSHPIPIQCAMTMQ